MQYVLEVKSEKELDGYFGCTCDRPATRLVEIGLEKFQHGQFFTLCHSEECLESCFELVEEKILSGPTYEPDIEQLKMSA